MKPIRNDTLGTTPPPAADFDIKTFFRDWPDGFDLSPQEARAACPYKVGDILPYKDSPTPHSVKVGLIHAIRTEYLEHYGSWIPVFYIRPLTVAGQWARAYKRVYPGEWSRAKIEVFKEEAGHGKD